MGEMQVAMIIGSLRRDSINRKLAHAVASLAPLHVSFRSVDIGDLPLYNQDDDSNPAPEVLRLKRAVASAQGGQPELFFHVQHGTFDPNGGFADGIVRGLVSTWLERYLSWVKLHLS